MIDCDENEENAFDSLFDDEELELFLSNDENVMEAQESSHDGFDAAHNSDELCMPVRKKAKRSRISKKKIMAEKVKQWELQQYAIANIPKLIKNDVRRLYLEMYGNILNATDVPLYFDFLSTYCSKDFTQHLTINKSNKTIPVPKMIQFNGIHIAVQHWYNETQTQPDMTYTINNVQLHVFSNTNKSHITCDLTMCTTRLYDISHNCLVPSNSIVTDVYDNTTLKSDENTSDSGTCDNNDQTNAATEITTLSTVPVSPIDSSNISNSLHKPPQSFRFLCSPNGMKIDTHINNVLSTAKLLKEPEKIVFEAKLWMYLDEHGCIERVVIESNT